MVSRAVLFAPAERHDGRDGPLNGHSRSTEPIALLPVGNRPMLAHALDELTASGVDGVAVLSERELAEEVDAALEAWDGPKGSVEHLPVDAGESFLGALAHAAPHMDGERFLVHLCDSLRHDSLAAAIEEAPGGSHDVLALVEAPDPDATPVGAGLASLRSAGIYVFGPGVLELGGDEGVPARWDVQIATATERLQAAGGQVELRAVEHFWRYGRRPDVLLQANRFFLSGMKPGRPTEAWLENTDLQGPVSIDPSARLRSATIRGPVIIGPDVEISDAYIGPYSSIGRGVQIENAEVEHSIVLPGASIRNLGGRLEASVVGPGARVFRDFRLPRALRLNIGEGAEVAIS
jgi:glucose-1-phosphate thymidylyltransferase